jgi:NADH-quinone oxidoreductase subunit K
MPAIQSALALPTGSLSTDMAPAVATVAGIPLEHGLLLAAVLFSLGLAGLLVRRNILFVLMSVEVMMNAAALAFVVAGARWVQPDGQIMFILILSLAASEASVGLAILLQLYHRYQALDIDAASEMRG